MTVRAVYDTNIIVSAALKPGSIPAALMSLAIEQRVLPYISPPILEKYTEVLHRQKFGFERHSVETFLDNVRQSALLVHPAMRLEVAADFADNRFLECALEAHADFLVTGNLRHFPAPDFQGIRIMEPSRFAQVLAEML